MSLIPAESLRALRNDVPVLAVISELRIPLKMRGRRQTFRCPGCARFHTATNPRTNLAHCFSCERNFNPIDIVMAERRGTFLEAVRYLQNLAPTALAYTRGQPPADNLTAIEGGVTTAPERGGVTTAPARATHTQKGGQHPKAWSLRGDAEGGSSPNREF